MYSLSGTAKRLRDTEAQAVACGAIGCETVCTAQDHISLYCGDAKLFSESLEDVQRTATLVLNVIGADEFCAPAA